MLDKKTPPLAFGSAIHETLSEVMYPFMAFQHMDDGDVQLAFDEVWDKHAEDVDWSDSKTSKSTYMRRGRKMMIVHRDWLLMEPMEDVLVLERKFEVPKSSTLPSLKGIIDKVVRDPSGELAVIDYKSGAKVPNEIILGKDPQFTVYYAGAKELIGEEITKFGLHHLASNRIYWTRRSSKDLEELSEAFEEAQAKVDQEMFSRNVSFACQWCPFIKPCLGGKDAG